MEFLQLERPRWRASSKARMIDPSAQDNALGALHRIAISADVSTIVEVIRVRHKGGAFSFCKNLLRAIRAALAKYWACRMECPYANVGQTEGERAHATSFGAGMRRRPGTGCGNAEDAADDKLLTPLRNSNRFKHLSIVASSRSSTCRSSNRRSTVAVSPISTDS